MDQQHFQHTSVEFCDDLMPMKKVAIARVLLLLFFVFGGAAFGQFAQPISHSVTVSNATGMLVPLDANFAVSNGLPSLAGTNSFTGPSWFANIAGNGSGLTNIQVPGPVYVGSLGLSTNQTIQAATANTALLNSAQSQTNWIVCPPGLFFFNGTVYLTNNSLYLEGSGAGHSSGTDSSRADYGNNTGTTFAPWNTNFGVLQIGNDTSHLVGINVSKIGFSGLAHGGGYAPFAFAMTSCHLCNVDKCWFENAYTNFSYFQSTNFDTDQNFVHMCQFPGSSYIPGQICIANIASNGFATGATFCTELSVVQSHVQGPTQVASAPTSWAVYNRGGNMFFTDTHIDFTGTNGMAIDFVPSATVALERPYVVFDGDAQLDNGGGGAWSLFVNTNEGYAGDYVWGTGHSPPNVAWSDGNITGSLFAVTLPKGTIISEPMVATFLSLLDKNNPNVYTSQTNIILNSSGNNQYYVRYGHEHAFFVNNSVSVGGAGAVEVAAFATNGTILSSNLTTGGGISMTAGSLTVPQLFSVLFTDSNNVTAASGFDINNNLNFVGSTSPGNMRMLLPNSTGDFLWQIGTSLTIGMEMFNNGLMSFPQGLSSANGLTISSGGVLFSTVSTTTFTGTVTNKGNVGIGGTITATGVSDLSTVNIGTETVSNLFTANGGSLIAGITNTGPATNSGVVGFGSNIAISGLATRYNGLNLAESGVPSCVTNLHLTAQAAAIGSTTLFTPSANGYFLMTVGMEITTAGSSGTIQTDVGFTTLAGHTHTGAYATSTAAVATAGTTVQGVFFFAAKGGTAITYQTIFNTVVGSPAYSIDVELVQF